MRDQQPPCAPVLGRWGLGTGLGLACLGLLTAPAAAQERAAIDLVTHSAVEIERPAAAVWPYIVDPSEWKQGLALRHHHGERGREGEVLAAYDPAAPSTVVFLAENVELVPQARRTIKLVTPDGTLLGFATWSLVEEDGRTTVTYDVYSETVLPSEESVGITQESLAAMERDGYEANKRRFDAELVALKKLLEGDPSR